MPESANVVEDTSEPWSGTLSADLYVSVVHEAGLPAFLRGDFSNCPSELRAYGPYWSDLSGQLAAFDAHKTVLVPALRMDRKVLGLSRDQVAQLGEGVEIRRNEQDDGDRFWHMKVYWIRHGDRIRTAVGSCNFTQAGLSGRNGNVEAMLVFDADPSWLPRGIPVQFDRLAEEAEAEEGTAEPVPLAVVVAWDWLSHDWRWWLEADSGQSNFKLHLPDVVPFAIKSGTGGPKAGKPPARGSTFRLSYRTTRGEEEWQGVVVELNLDYSSRIYGPPITANDILESWRCLAPTWDLGGSGGDGDPSNDPDEIGSHSPAAFEALNLFDFYRSAKALGAKLQGLRKKPNLLRGYLVGRSDSVMALAHLADRAGDAPVVRFLVLRELYSVVSRWTDIVDEELVARVKQMEKRARDRTLDQLAHEMGGDEQKARSVLDWFEKELAGLDRGMGA
ncbi:MAG: phospholipase D family protein [Bryobacterales bacterium]|nr:phospholipase D family protein [Bryobacterales bacterium]MDE0620839.1 phospholipase D family protein [Bryobacterales bacterium]